MRYVVVLLCCAPCFGGTLYTDPVAWEAALAGLPIDSLTLTPQAIPLTASHIVDDQIIIDFPVNHGGNSLLADGWIGDVHAVGPPPFNHFTFTSPIRALGFNFGFNESDGDDTTPLFRITLDQAYLFSRAQYPVQTPRFLGWIGDDTITEMHVTTNVSATHYQMNQVRFSPVPLPAAFWAGLALMPLAIAKRRISSKPPWPRRSWHSVQ